MKLKNLFIFILMITFNVITYSQGQVIDRKTKSGKDFSVTILVVDTDSLTYKYFGKTKTVPLTSVIAYRVDYRSGPFIFPNPKDKEAYLIVNNDAIEKSDVHPSLSKKERDSHILKILKQYELPSDLFQKKTLKHKILLRSMDGLQTVSANPRKGLYIVMKNDPLKEHLGGKLFKIANDSAIYIVYRLNKKRHFYAVDKNEIKYIGFESVKNSRTRIIAGIICSVILPVPPLVLIPIYIFSHPKIERYDIENEWKLALTPQS